MSDEMAAVDYERLERDALNVLWENDRNGMHTVPAAGMYEHTWLWDSALTSIGLAHIDPKRAGTELDTVFDGQWRNGMIPNMTFTVGRLGGNPSFKPDFLIWNSRLLNPNAPRHAHTSGITQPPIMAEAVQRVAHAMDHDDRLAFTKQAVSRLIPYHTWIYTDRNPRGNGLFAAIHPWETGMENTPAWMHHMAAIDWGKQEMVFNGINKAMQLVRRDTKHANADERATVNETQLYIQSLAKLVATRYDAQHLADKYPLHHIEDVHMNSALIRNNEILQELAVEIDQPLPDSLEEWMEQTRENIDQLWDEEAGMYYPRDALTGYPIKVPTVASLMPLYGGATDPQKTAALLAHVHDPTSFGLPYGVPTVPADSPDYREKGYWSGPSWVNMNWLLLDGMDRLGEHQAAERLGRSTLAMVAAGGMKEYFAPRTAEGLGAKDFSWTAALVIDLMHRYPAEA